MSSPASNGAALNGPSASGTVDIAFVDPSAVAFEGGQRAGEASGTACDGAADRRRDGGFGGSVHIADERTRTALDAAAERLRRGKLIAFPTETVYGLGASATSTSAVRSIFATKGRPADNPLIVHVASRRMLDDLVGSDVTLPPSYGPLLDAFWPGALSFLVPFAADQQRRTGVADEVTAGLPSLVVRMPSHPIARALIALADVPVAAPSANTSGRPSPTTAQHVAADYAARPPHHDVLVLDGGPCNVGVESTVVDGVTEPGVLRVLRPGGIGPAAMRTVLDAAGLTDVPIRVFGRDWSDAALAQQPTTPGMKYRHYAPDAPVIVIDIVSSDDATDATTLAELIDGRRAGLLAPASSALDADRSVGQIVMRSSLGSTAEAHAQRLFAGLRELDGAGLGLIIVERPSGADWLDGVGLAVAERARKAAGNAAFARIRIDRN